VFLITFTESFLKENVHREIFKEFPFLLAETVFPKTFKKHYRQLVQGKAEKVFRVQEI